MRSYKLYIIHCFLAVVRDFLQIGDRKAGFLAREVALSVSLCLCMSQCWHPALLCNVQGMHGCCVVWCGDEASPQPSIMLSTANAYLHTPDECWCCAAKYDYRTGPFFCAGSDAGMARVVILFLLLP